MNVATMRLIDRWLGVPVCALLSIWRRLFDRRRSDRDHCPSRILFVKLAEQGSTVLAQGALHAAVERVGRENVYFVLFRENRPILDVLDLIPAANVIEIRTEGLAQTILSALRAVRKLRTIGVDVAIDLEFFARASAALSYLSGARWRVGYHAFGAEASYRGDLMTHRLSFNPYLHTTQTFEMMVDALDSDPAELPTLGTAAPPVSASPAQFYPTAAELEAVHNLVRPHLDQGRRLILLNANASDLIPLRKWSSARYVELARLLLARYPDVVIAFTGAPGEHTGAEVLAAQVNSPRCLSLAGKTTLRELLVLFGLAEVLVTNDSGPAHFATLTPIDVVVLFGPETPKLFAAPSPRTHPLWAGLACSPCINAFNNRSSPCTNNVCMQAITVAQVFAEVCRHYESRRTDKALQRSA